MAKHFHKSTLLTAIIKEIAAEEAKFTDDLILIKARNSQAICEKFMMKISPQGFQRKSEEKTNFFNLFNLL